MIIRRANFFFRLISLGFTLFFFTCQERVFENPYDENSIIDPQTWAPSQLQAQMLADSTIKLTWQQEIEKINGFKIDRKVGALEWQNIANDIAVSDREWIDTNLVVNTTLYYKIYAYAGNNESAYDSASFYVSKLIEIPTEGLVAYYPFNGNAEDESDHENDGAVNGPTPTADRFGNANSAYSFDGVNDMIALTTDELGPIANLSSSSWGISLWFKSSTTTSSGSMIMCAREDGPNKEVIYVYIENNNLKSSIRDDDSDLESMDVSFTDISSWHHIVFTFDNDKNIASLFLDNENVGSMSINSQMLSYYSTIGAMRHDENLTPRHIFNGKLDDIRIYNHALSDTEIIALYNENVVYVEGCTDSNAQNYNVDANVDDESCEYDATDTLVAHYPFNGNAEDATGNGNDGTVSGATLTNNRFDATDNAYSFDGVDDFIEIINPLNEETNNYSLSAWIYLNSIPSNDEYFIISSGSMNGPQQLNLAVSYEGGGIPSSGRLLCSGSFSGNENIYSDQVLVKNQWYYVTCIIEQDHEMHIYINGSNYKKTEQISGNIISSEDTHDLVIGRRAYSHAGYFDGAIDDIEIYNYALSETEIEQVYCNNGWCTQDCTDPAANNYDSSANIDDGSCTYPDNGDYSLSFDGDDYVEVNLNKNLNYSTGTICTWFQTDGGFTECEKIIHLAQAENIRTVITSSLETSIGRNACLHIVLSNEITEVCGLATGCLLSEDKPLSPILGGKIGLSESPGLGIDL